jgi:hypothetical protein
MTAPSPYLNRKQAAAYANCSAVTVYRAWVQYRKTGKSGLRASQPGGVNGVLLFHRDDLDRWIAGEAPSRAAAGRRRVAS